MSQPSHLVAQHLLVIKRLNATLRAEDCPVSNVPRRAGRGGWRFPGNGPRNHLTGKATLHLLSIRNIHICGLKSLIHKRNSSHARSKSSQGSLCDPGWGPLHLLGRSPFPWLHPWEPAPQVRGCKPLSRKRESRGRDNPSLSAPLSCLPRALHPSDVQGKPRCILCCG